MCQVLTGWRCLLSRLHLSRAGRIVFTVIATLGGVLTIADDLLPRSGSEADSGPNIAAVVGIYTLVALAVVVMVDRGSRAAGRRLARPSRSHE
jgi:hypothetical protein